MFTIFDFNIDFNDCNITNDWHLYMETDDTYYEYMYTRSVRICSAIEIGVSQVTANDFRINLYLNYTGMSAFYQYEEIPLVELDEKKLKEFKEKVYDIENSTENNNRNIKRFLSLCKSKDTRLIRIMMTIFDVIDKVNENFNEEAYNYFRSDEWSSTPLVDILPFLPDFSYYDKDSIKYRNTMVIMAANCIEEFPEMGFTLDPSFHKDILKLKLVDPDGVLLIDIDAFVNERVFRIRK